MRKKKRGKGKNELLFDIVYLAGKMVCLLLNLVASTLSNIEKAEMNLYHVAKSLL